MITLADRLLPDALWRRIQPLLPAKELGCGSATTCWRRLDEWACPGVFEQLQGCCWTSWVRPAGSTWRESAWTLSACGR
jgi:transposase